MAREKFDRWIEVLEEEVIQGWGCREAPDLQSAYQLGR